MLAPRFHLYLLSSICLSTAHSHKLSPVENELRDLVTQNSVIRCGGMASVIKGFRDGTIATVEWPSLIEAALELERASDELLWYMHMVEWLDIQTGNPQSQASRTLLMAKDHVDSALDQVQSWLVQRV